LDWKPRSSWLINLFGGALMGFGVALAHGGNDSLVLYAIPILSPHALPGYAALAVGVAAGLLTIRLLLGIETRAECRNDLYYSVTARMPCARLLSLRTQPATPDALDHRGRGVEHDPHFVQWSNC
jgi:hypothetical protein